MVYGFYLRAWVFAAVTAMLCLPGNEVCATSPSAIYKIGTVAALGDFSATLNHVAVASEGHGTNVEIKYTIENISPAPVPLTQFPTLYLEDRKGGVFEAMAGEAGSVRMLAPGAQISRRARFHAPGDHMDTLDWLLRAGDAHGPRITLH